MSSAVRPFRARLAQILGLTTLVLILAACQGPASTLNPSGPRAAQDAQLWWIMVGLGTLVYVLVLGLLFYATFRSRRRQEAEQGEIVDSNLLIIGGGIAIPLIILPVIWLLTLQSMVTLAAPSVPPRVTIEVIGHQWWYEVRYPDSGITLKNDMRIPVGEPVQLEITSADVIHSFWVPRLMGKIDMIPGRINERWFEASQPGAYLVECAEFCGLLHAKMQMHVVAMPPAEFSAWLASQRR